jgi:hypothetical protein
MALYCWARPLAMEAVAGLTVTETSAGGITVKVAVPFIEPDAAVMVEVPTAVVIAIPPLEMVAPAVALQVGVTDCVVPSE